MLVQVAFFEIDRVPAPTVGDLLVAVNPSLPGLSSFVTTVRSDEMGFLDDQGDSFMFSDDITHWAYLPEYPAGS
jgi:hypothetical protein